MMIEPYPDLDQLVTIGKFLEPIAARIAKGMLEAAGIECFLQGENANNMLALAFRSRLQVRCKDQEAALELLEASDEQLGNVQRRFDA